MKEFLSPEEIEALLRSKSISDRAKAMRHFEHHGDLDDVQQLVGIASKDKSIAVRNNASDAIADIFSRFRHGPSKSQFSEEARLTMLKLLRRIKPQHTPAVFLAYAALGIPNAFQILIAGFMDPRTEIQNCAAAGLRCYCLSGDVVNEDAIEQRLIEVIQDPRIDVPRIAHIVRLCAEAGYTQVAPLLASLPSSAMLTDIVQATQVHLKHSESRPIGMWYTQGLDALEFNPAADRGDRFLLVTQEATLLFESGEWKEIPEILNDIQRRLFFRPIGHAESVHAVQTSTDTWLWVQPMELQALLQQETQLDLPVSRHLGVLGSWLESRLKDNAKNNRILAILFMRSEQWDLTAHYVNKGLSLTKPSVDLWFVESKRLYALGHKKKALSALKKCLALVKTEHSILTRECQVLKEEIERLG
jgi:hypothetical protein